MSSRQWSYISKKIPRAQEDTFLLSCSQTLGAYRWNAFLLVRDKHLDDVGNESRRVTDQEHDRDGDGGPRYPGLSLPQSSFAAPAEDGLFAGGGVGGGSNSFPLGSGRRVAGDGRRSPHRPEYHVVQNAHQREGRDQVADHVGHVQVRL